MPGRARRNSARIMFSSKTLHKADAIPVGGTIQRNGSNIGKVEVDSVSQAAMRRCLSRVAVVACTASVRRIRDFSHEIGDGEAQSGKKISGTLGLYMRQLEVRIGMSCCERYLQSRRARESRIAWQVWGQKVAALSKYYNQSQANNP